jgi:hypothetical protein
MHDFHGTFSDLLHAANLHGTDGFTSPPKEGVLRIFPSFKIRRLRSGLNPRTWILKASTLPLDHRSRNVWALKSPLCVVEQRCIKNLLPVRIHVESVFEFDEDCFLILRVDANILQKLLRTDEKVLFQLWAGSGSSILSH